MADDKKAIGSDVGTSAEATEQPRPAPNLSDTAAHAPLGPEALTVEELVKQALRNMITK